MSNAGRNDASRAAADDASRAAADEASRAAADEASRAAADGEPRTYGFELPLLLFGGFRSIIDELHAELARRGHPDMRPAHGFALQAIGPHGATATEVGRRLGISKQAAGKTIDRLAELGYVHKAGDDSDRRRKLVRITPRGRDALAQSAMIFEDIRSRWQATLGTAKLSALEQDLRTMAPGQAFRLDVPGWFGA